jgi:hypothetical protein
MRKLLSGLCWCAILPFFASAQERAPTTAPELLSFDDLIILSDTDRPTALLKEKLDALLTTPFLSNEAALAGGQPRRPTVEGS